VRRALTLRAAGLAGAVFLLAAPAAVASTAGSVAVDLAALGPRVPGTPAHREAGERLLAAMSRLGLAEVAAVPVPGRPELENLTGLLKGEGEGEIVLAAHYDTVPGSPGAVDDASGCEVVLAAVEDLARTPLRHSVRVVLFDGEEQGLAGSRAWAEGLDEKRRDGILAALEVEMVGWEGGCGPVVLPLPAWRQGRRLLPPGWLVHAVLRGGDAVGREVAVLDRPWSLPAQLALRVAEPAHGSDAAALLGVEIPAVVLSQTCLSGAFPHYHAAGDGPGELVEGRLAEWTELTAAVVRRLDDLAGRPLAESSYLVVGGRVWLRRDLYWLGFAIWAALVVASYRARMAARGAGEGGEGTSATALPGRLRGGSFPFRLLFLAATLVVPALAAPLLYPAGVFALVPATRRRLRVLEVALGLAPALLLGAGLAVVAARGEVSRWALGWFPGGLLAAALAAFAASLLGAKDTVPQER
jgi:Peptidase family M28